MSELIAANIWKSLDGLAILEGISLQIAPRSITSIIGPSGCGKSTFFHILSGLLQPDDGFVQMGENNISGKPGKIGYLQQKDCLFPWKNVLSNVMLPLLLKKIPQNEARATALKHLSNFGLKGFETYYPSELSGGMRQRAALLRTYLCQSPIMLLDEPFAQLDAITRKKMQTWLLGIQESLQLTILMITHDIDEAVFLSDRIVVFSPLPGKIRASYELYPPKPRTLSYLASKEFSHWKQCLMDLLF